MSTLPYDLSGPRHSLVPRPPIAALAGRQYPCHNVKPRRPLVSVDSRPTPDVSTPPAVSTPCRRLVPRAIGQSPRRRSVPRADGQLTTHCAQPGVAPAVPPVAWRTCAASGVACVASRSRTGEAGGVRRHCVLPVLGAQLQVRPLPDPLPFLDYFSLM